VEVDARADDADGGRRFNLVLGTERALPNPDSR
jgi:hypothetical protein